MLVPMCVRTLGPYVRVRILTHVSRYSIVAAVYVRSRLRPLLSAFYFVCVGKYYAIRTHRHTRRVHTCTKYNNIHTYTGCRANHVLRTYNLCGSGFFFFFFRWDIYILEIIIENYGNSCLSFVRNVRNSSADTIIDICNAPYANIRRMIS